MRRAVPQKSEHQRTKEGTSKEDFSSSPSNSSAAAAAAAAPPSVHHQSHSPPPRKVARKSFLPSPPGPTAAAAAEPPTAAAARIAAESASSAAAIASGGSSSSSSAGGGAECSSGLESVHGAASWSAELQHEKKVKKEEEEQEEGIAAEEEEEADVNSMQQADWIRPYTQHSHHLSAAAAAAEIAAAAAAAQYPYYPAAMPPSVHHRLSSMDHDGRSSAASAAAGLPFGLSNMDHHQQQHQQMQLQHQQQHATSSSATASNPLRYDATPLSHYPGLNTDYYSFGYGGMPPTTHIPLDSYQQHQQHQHQQQQQRMLGFPARPQPTRPSLGTDMGFKVEPMQAPQTPSASSRSQPSSSSALKDKINNNSSSSGVGSVGSNNNPSPQHNNISSPSASAPGSLGGPLSPAGGNGGSSKFRYPSGPNNSVQSTLGSSSPHNALLERGPPTPSSGLSSREGTPLPSLGGIKEEPAPNVDISRVQIKDMHYTNFSPPPAPPALSSTSSSSSSFAQQSNSSFFSQMRGSSTFPAPSAGFYSPSSQISMDGVSDRGAGATGAGGAAGVAVRDHAALAAPSSHGHVKIGRRPAHLPKVLKFNDKTLPPGWIRKLKQRKHGKQAGRWDVYIYSPCGVKFASRKKLKGFFEKNNLIYDPEDFDFTPYGRHMDSRAAGGGGAAGSAHPSGGSGSSASRHDSSGSTGSDCTHPGSSPSSLANYSPTHSSPYMPQSMSLGGGLGGGGLAGGLIGQHSIAVTASAAPAAFADYSSFAQFDPHMESPPNACALDVPGSDFGHLLGVGSAGGAGHLPYLHLGRGQHHPIMHKDLGQGGAGGGDTIFSSADMMETLTGSSLDALHNGFPGLPSTTSAAYADLSRGLQPLSNASAGSRTSEDEGDDSSRARQQKMGAAAALNRQIGNGMELSSSSAASSTGNNNGGVHMSLGADASLQQQQERGFSLERTMSVLQASQAGYEDYYEQY